MPRIGGINVVGVALAAIAFYMIGYVFYGVLFTDEWIAQTLAMSGVAELDSIRQMSPERIENAWKEAFPTSDMGTSIGLGFANAVFTVIVLAVVLRLLTSDGPSLIGHIGFAILLALGFSLTGVAADHIYAAKPMVLFWIDAGHTLVAYVVAAIVLSFFE